MSDIDLRTRIATALWKFAQPDSRFPDPPEVFFGMADAVISELGLREVSIPEFGGAPAMTAYVTDWTAGDGGQTKQYGPSPKITTRKADDAI